MLASAIAPAADRLAGLGHALSGKIHYQSTPDQLVQDTLRLGEGVLSDSGALVIRTGEFTGRSPKDKYLVSDPQTSPFIFWNEFNNPLSEEHFDAICSATRSYFTTHREWWVRDCFVCADDRYRVNVRVISEKPWSDLFAFNMFLRPEKTAAQNDVGGWLIFVVPGLKLDPAQCGTRKPNASVISFKHRMIIIAGSGYTGEIKKSVFTMLNYLLPQERDVLSMHCSANVGEMDDTALFFGLSGTGKTTLSADPQRSLIGDDEHGWTNDGIFNFEGGCYAKVINLSPGQEPQIFGAIRNGALLENTTFFPGTRTVDFESSSITENTRVSYPVHYIDHARIPSTGPVPANIFFLTCDAYGVLPPISRLSREQAMYHFISGYTAKIAGTESGITEPVSTFSACFGAPFLPLHPAKYAALLGERLAKHQVKVWLVNTGWTGGAYGTGTRIKLSFTRNMISAALTGYLDTVQYHSHPVFGMEIPVCCAGVPAGILNPRDTWPDPSAYDEQAAALAARFVKNFGKYAAGVSPEVLAAAPVCA